MAEDGVSVIWEGLHVLYDALDEKAKEVDQGSKTIVAKGSALLIARAKMNFEGSHKKGTPTLAQPGEHPSIITGYLRRSIIATGIIRAGLGHYFTTVGPTAVYGRAVELGLRNGAAYPYFTPAAREVGEEIRAISEEIWAELLR